MKEGDGGTITNNRCPKCGRFVKIPDTYMFDSVKGAVSSSYCKHCRIIICLPVEFI